MKGARESKRAKKKKAREANRIATPAKSQPRNSTVARKRYLATLAPNRRFLVELDDLMERMWKERRPLSSTGEWPLGQMLDALERHYEKVRSEINQLRSRRLFLVPLTEAQHKEWEDEAKERPVFFDERYLFGTWFNSSPRPSRGRPSDEFRSKRIAAYSLFKEWEGEPHKGAIADATARYKCSRPTVYKARKQWCPQMQHLRPHFNQATAKVYRERIERVEDNQPRLVRRGLSTAEAWEAAKLLELWRKN
jgi:hypothetical protein